MRKHLTLVLAAVAGLGVLAGGQSLNRDVRITLREGTSMAAAVSPDGRTIAIDLTWARCCAVQLVRQIRRRLRGTRSRFGGTSVDDASAGTYPLNSLEWS